MDQLTKFPNILMDTKDLLLLAQKPSLPSLFLKGPFCSYYYSLKMEALSVSETLYFLHKLCLRL